MWVGVGVSVGVRVRVGVRVWVAVAVLVALGVLVAVGVFVEVGVLVAVGVSVLVSVIVGVLEAGSGVLVARGMLVVAALVGTGENDWMFAIVGSPVETSVGRCKGVGLLSCARPIGILNASRVNPQAASTKNSESKV